MPKNSSNAAVVANQKKILQNQALLLKNQTAIKQNQQTIRANQAKLDQIVKNQVRILSLLKK